MSSARLTAEEFQLFYERTARPLHRYLVRAAGSISAADDLLQESYLHLLRSRLPADASHEHRKNYLFKIATNLLYSEARRHPEKALTETPSPEHLEKRVGERTDMQQILRELKPRERQLLWLAYVEQFDHREIASIVGARPQSIRPMLSRARSRLAGILRNAGFRPAMKEDIK